ncbi:thymidine kinase [Propionibacterium cyclohexanicum]|nr:thymidine kinase [Propionibacterium cyclohexanicum]
MDASAPATAQLLFFSGPMNSGKSTLALQTAHTQSAHDRRGLLFTRQDRSGAPEITSRVGMSRPAVEVDDALDFWAMIVKELTSGARIDFLVCDEVQFYTPTHIDELARVVDELGIDVFCFGILSDFRSLMFPGSRRLVELADRVETMQVQPLCWCGARGTMNARVREGHLVRQGEQVLIADTAEGTPAGLHYEVLCRKHFRLGMGRPLHATLSPQTLPFG